jgi:hypothetical protein
MTRVDCKNCRNVVVHSRDREDDAFCNGCFWKVSLNQSDREMLKNFGVPYGSRTRVAAVKGRCPRPLDERDAIGLGV